MKQFIFIHLDKPRKLRFSMGTMVGFEQSTGKKILECLKNFNDDIAIEMLWFMLKNGDPNITIFDRIKIRIFLLFKRKKLNSYISDKVLDTIYEAFYTKDSGKKNTGTGEKKHKELDYLTFENESEIAIKEMGLLPDAFWAMTSGEFVAQNEGFIEQIKYEYNRGIKQAWYTAYFIDWRRTAKEGDSLNLEDYLLGAKTAEPEIQDPKQIIGMMHALAFSNKALISETAVENQ